jgi:PAS domain S-box-containing protein
MDGFWLVDLQGNLLDVNETYCEMSGYSKQELLNMSIKDLESSETSEETSVHIQKIKSKGEDRFISQHHRKNGELFYVEVSTQYRPDDGGQLVCFLRDITDRKRTEDLLRESASNLLTLHESMRDAFVSVTMDGRLLDFNSSFLELLGYPEVELRSKTYVDLTPEKWHDFEARIVAEQVLPRGFSEVYEKEYRHKNGTLIPIELRTVLIRDASGEPELMWAIIRDIGERKRTEAALIEAKYASDQASRAKSEFLAKMSHELRTPMTAIIGFGELLEGADLTPEHKRYLAAINTSGNALSSLIDDVLDLSKVDAGEITIKPKEFSLHNLITKLVTTQEQQIARKNLSFNISIDSDVPDLLIGDLQRIQQVLLNLLGNAIKFTEKGDIGITVSVAEENNLWVLLNFAVRDTGCGISADRLEYIFEPFAQALGSTHVSYGGSGLGLTISRSLAGLMGGIVSVESQEGIGSTFYLLLPLKKNNDNLSERPLPQREASLWCGPVLNILLAEDNPINSQFIETVLKDMGHAVANVENGKVAIDTLKMNTFDLVLMDIQMPVMNGVDVLKAIREMEQLSGKHLTVIALTAYALIGDKEKYLNMGFDGYLSKPFKTKELMDEMLRVVSR